MKITIHGGTIEHIRDALDAVVEGTDDARVVRDMSIAALEIGDKADDPFSVDQFPTLTLVSKDRQEVARWDAKYGCWERSHICDDCGREDLSPHTEWKCNCVVDPMSNNPEGWRE